MTTPQPDTLDDCRASATLAFGDWTLDLMARELRRGGEPYPLRRQLIDVLCHLARNRHRVVSSEELLVEIWSGVHVTRDAISQAVKDLRRALGDDGVHQAIIGTQRGRGYRFRGAPLATAGSAIAGSGRRLS